MVKITDVERGSIADRLGILPGHTLVSINGNEINDVLDYRFYLTERNITLDLLSDEGRYTCKTRKGEYDDIGLGFETPLMDKKHSCKNGCIFCFIDQNPEGMRESIYFKDDDSRLSFIHGNYITLTNMDEKDVARIIKMRISPINISVHTTNPDLRVKMMKNKRAGQVLSYLDDFKRAGLSMCGQIVLCKGVNDGDELRRSLSDLSKYFPEMGSVSVVPAGLTEHRDGLFPLSDFTESEAGEIIDLVDEIATECLDKHGSRIFFCADELYLKANRPIPGTEYYEDYPQIDNGVGMLRSFSDEFNLALESYPDFELEKPRRVTVVTAEAAYPMLSSFAEILEEKYADLKVNVKKIINDFFGHSITVSGLMTGRDICAQLSGEDLGDELLLPANCLRDGEDVFLCGMSTDSLAQTLGCDVGVVESDGYAFALAVLGIEELL